MPAAVAIPLAMAGAQTATSLLANRSANKTADKMAEREVNTEREQMAMRERMFQQLLPILAGRMQQSQSAYNPWAMLGQNAAGDLGQMLNHPSSPQQPMRPNGPPVNPWANLSMLT